MSAEKVVNEIVEFKPFETNLEEFKGQYVDIVYDLFDKDQEKKAKSDKLAIGKVISALDKKHKELKAPLKAKTDLIDHERKRIKDELLSMQGAIKHQLEHHEFKKAEHDTKLFNMVKAIEDLAVFSEFEQPDSGQLQVLIEKAESIDVDDSYEHRKADATLAQVDAIKKLKVMFEAACDREEKDRELERLKAEEEKRQQLEREEQIRKEATEKAKREAEQAAQKKIDDAEKDGRRAIEETKQAKEKAKQQAELAAKQERERIEAEQAEAKRIADEAKAKEDAKKAKQAHRAKIHKAAKQSLIDSGIDEELATNVVNLIKDGKIKNIHIEY